MRKSIVFLCPCLEEGKDGVGDYSRRMGEALTKSGYDVYYVSLNDHVVACDVEDGDARVLRLSTELKWSDRKKRLAHFIKKYDPEWVSLQWVGFGYEKRGLPWSMLGLIKEIRRGRRLHLFFHEIWLGEKPGLPWRHRVLGTLQEWLTWFAVKRWEPDLAHTSNLIYRAALERCCLRRVSVLALPGNIPICANTDSSVVEHPLLEILKMSSVTNLRITLFGSLDKEWEPKSFCQFLASWAEQRGCTVWLIAVGSMGNGAGKWNQMKVQFKETVGLRFVETGQLDAEAISFVFQHCQIGATTKSFELLGKSGAFAALAEHGLPVIALRSPEESNKTSSVENWEVPVILYETEDTIRLSKWLDQVRVKRIQSSPRLPKIAEIFSSDLEVI